MSGKDRTARMMALLEAEAERMLTEMEAKAAQMRPLVEAEAKRMRAQLETEVSRARPPTSSEVDGLTLPNCKGRVVDERVRAVSRADYVSKEQEQDYLGRNNSGQPDLHLVDAGDRLVIWSPFRGGGIINPKAPGIRRLGLCCSSARGSNHYRVAYRTADLSKGQWIDLVREPGNLHDQNAVKMCAPGSVNPFGYVQRGRAAGVAHRMDAGEQIAAVSLRGPGKGREDDSTLALTGARSDLVAMLDPA